MYGGHITDGWDRRLCRTYLEEFIRCEMMEGELHLAPGFPLPGNMDYNGYHQVRQTQLAWWLNIEKLQIKIVIRLVSQAWPYFHVLSGH